MVFFLSWVFIKQTVVFFLLDPSPQRALVVMFGRGRREESVGTTKRKEGDEKNSHVLFHSFFTDCLPDELIFVAGCQSG